MTRASSAPTTRNATHGTKSRAEDQPIPAPRGQSLLLYTLWVVGVAGWWLTPTRYIADDSYFYPVSARRLVLEGEHTFSGIFPTNGVHPAWFYLLAAYSRLVAVVSPDLLYDARYAVPLCALLLFKGLVDWRAVARRAGIPVAPLVGLPLAFLVSTGVLYSEAHASYAAIGALFRWVQRPTQSASPSGVYLVAGGLLLGVTVLARLDNVFLLLAFLVWFVARKRSAAATAVLVAVTVGVIAPYLVANTVFFGGMLPVSGWMKSSFPTPFLFQKGVSCGGLNTSIFNVSVLLGVLPILFATIALGVLHRWLTPRQTDLATVLLAGSVMHLLYVALFTRSHTLWYWYYVLPVVTGAWAAALVAARLTPAVPTVLRSVLPALLVAFLIASIFMKRDHASLASRSEWALSYLDRNSQIPTTVLVSDWPGYLAFHSHHRIVAADLLTANRRLYERMKASGNALAELLRHCREQGYPIRHIVFLGNLWLVPDDSGQSLVYNDPHEYPILIPFGTLRFARPPLELVREQNNFRFAGWMLDEDDAAGSSPVTGSSASKSPPVVTR